ncbi:adenine deaminase [Pontibacter ummariensis]|uniref:Adenine deaminase n=1 Tax=Pontibacter ummariensis TaxID=1610492 RepID=A0A239DY98_9BACT|nr:adenine deaminase [Pontibacter ummariensis]PRY13695.1 adenine deaminase [Pontibacter ummariensis]SNS37327.1 Adenine deaminase [Pontibacter ummariensis]
MPTNFNVSGRIIDIHRQEIYPGTVHVSNGCISKIVREATEATDYILPGFVDAHVHVESSMLVPCEFARLAVPHGTVATVSDPHEIGNVLGLKGVEYMIENGKKVPFKFYFGAPSCVPATPFETAGAEVTAADIEKLFQREEIKYLAEMMNWPGTLQRDPVVMEKIELAKKYGKAVDGHAPGLMGEQAAQYASAGISTDHECFTAEEALDKLAVGMKILIREGSAAKNFEALIPLLPEHFRNIMFCSDDKHPDNLVEGHINLLVKRALAKGQDLFHVLQAACVNPVEHYKLEVGLLREGDPADFILIDSPENFNIQATYINGQLVAEQASSKIAFTESEEINNFHTSHKAPEQFAVPATDVARIRVIEAFDGQLITKEAWASPTVTNGFIVPDVAQDLLKITVVNRYEEAEPAVAFIKNIGLKEGAIASSVGHDSHNIVAVGVDDDSIARAVNLIIEAKGGVAAVSIGKSQLLPLPVAGIMSADDGYKVAEHYAALDRMAKEMGSKLASPFMTLSFMALLVIPSLKLSDKGLFNGDEFKFVPVAEKS